MHLQNQQKRRAEQDQPEPSKCPHPFSPLVPRPLGPPPRILGETSHPEHKRQMPPPQGHRLPRSAHTKVPSRLEEFALLSMRNDSESLDVKSVLHDSINADECGKDVWCVLCGTVVPAGSCPAEIAYARKYAFGFIAFPPHCLRSTRPDRVFSSALVSGRG
jgi:hypothetical protein